MARRGQQVRLAELLRNGLLGLGGQARVLEPSQAPQNKRLRGQHVGLDALQPAPSDRRHASIEKLERALVLPGRGSRPGRIDPRAVGKVRTADSIAGLAGSDRRAVGLDEATTAHQRQRARVGDVVDAPVAARVAFGAQLFQQALGLLDAPGHRLRPSACRQRFAPLIARRKPGPLDQLECSAGAVAGDTGEADRAVVGAGTLKP